MAHLFQLTLIDVRYACASPGSSHQSGRVPYSLEMAIHSSATGYLAGRGGKTQDKILTGGVGRSDLRSAVRLWRRYTGMSFPLSSQAMCPDLTLLVLTIVARTTTVLSVLLRGHCQ